MKIIIIGAGQVGSTLTEKLVTEKNELTVIDTDRSLLGILNGMVVIAVILCRKAHLVPRKVQLHAVLARKVTP